MNLLLHPDPAKCEEFLSLLGVAASLTKVDADGGFTLFANNHLTREFYGAGHLGKGVKLSLEGVKPLLEGERNQSVLKAYVDQMTTNYRAVVESKKTISTETSVLMPGGITRWSRNTLTPIFDETNSVARLLVTFIDVSELYKAREEIEESLSTLISQAVTVCAGCDKIAEGKDWLTMADYMTKHSEQVFTHGICDKCQAQYFGAAS